MDLATILSRVDARHYASQEQYLADVRLICHGTEQYYGSEAGGEGARYVSLASAMLDEASEMLRARLSADLVQRLWRIQGAGGPAAAPEGVATVEALAAEAIETADAAAGGARDTQRDAGGGRGGEGAGFRASGRLRGENLPVTVSLVSWREGSYLLYTSVAYGTTLCGMRMLQTASSLIDGSTTADGFESREAPSQGPAFPAAPNSGPCVHIAAAPPRG